MTMNNLQKRLPEQMNILHSWHEKHNLNLHIMLIGAIKGQGHLNKWALDWGGGGSF